MAEPSAEVRGTQIIVKLPVWQLGTLIGGSMAVVFSVWLTTRDLRVDMVRLSNAVDQLTTQMATMEALDRRVWQLEQQLGSRQQGWMDPYYHPDSGLEEKLPPLPWRELEDNG